MSEKLYKVFFNSQTNNIIKYYNILVCADKKYKMFIVEEADG